MYSPNFSRRTPPTVISVERRSRLKRLMRRWRAKRSLIISSVGMLPRTMRSWLERSTDRATPSWARSSSSVSTSPLSTPCNSASISSWERRSWVLMSLHHEAGEIHVLGRRLAAEHGQLGPDRLEGFQPQRFLALARQPRLVIAYAEQRDQRMAHGRHVLRDDLGLAGAERHHFDGDLQIAQLAAGGEIHHQRRVQRQVRGLATGTGLGLVGSRIGCLASR